MFRAKRRGPIVVGILALAIAGRIALSSYLRTPGENDFRFHRERYEAIVAKVKGLPIEPGQGKYAYVDFGMRPESLSLKPVDNADMAGRIKVFRTEEGNYKIALVTRDEGHFGTFGYVYSDAPDGPASAGELPEIERQVGPHWWIASNHSW